MTNREQYNQLIQYRKENPPVDCYIEIHHILPKCCGGDNCPENLVSLTGVEHFKAHYFLAKAMLEEHHPKAFKMVYALQMISGHALTSNRVLSSEELADLAMKYEEAKKLFHRNTGANNNFYGRHHSEETKRKISQANKGRKHSEQWKREQSKRSKQAWADKTEEERRAWCQMHSERMMGDNNPMRHLTEEQRLEDRQRKSKRSREMWAAKTPQQKEELRQIGQATMTKLWADPNSVFRRNVAGRHWFNNGTEELMAKVCPEGFTKGRLPKLTEAQRVHLSEHFRGMKFYNNGVITIRAHECPDGFVPGKLKQ